jgi:tRNA pseudouridine32 synthase/23S rRNA pseudouridine746 synthase
LASTTASPIRLIRENAAVLVADKPPGLAVVPARGEPAEACLHRVLERQVEGRLWVVHRIDREASGLVAFARTAVAHRELCAAFAERRVGKAYTAFVAGELKEARGRLEAPLHEARRGKARPARPGEPGGRPAVTDYVVERRWRADGLTVLQVEARPLTGRHHQIRVHLRAAGAPILFDRAYGRSIPAAPFAETPARRLALHARRLALPVGGEVLVVDAPIPDDLRALREWLDEGWTAAGRAVALQGRRDGGASPVVRR